MINRRDVGYVRADDKELDRKLREGDGVGWSGDPRLELRYGVLTAPKRMQHPATGRWLNRGDLVAKRYEVWDAVDEQMIGHWTVEEFDRILFDVSRMKAGAMGRIDGVEARIDKHNAKMDKDANDRFRDAYGSFAEHYLQLWHDRNNPKKTFRQVGGSDERPDRNLSK